MLTLERVNGQADIDMVALNRSPQDFSAQSLQAIISASATVGCAGQNFSFEALGQVPAGCLDYHWRFGDGGQAYTDTAHHSYPVPGTYQVILDVTATCDGRTVSDTISVTVRAPFVDAGPAVPVCPGDTAQLQGQALSPFQWQAHASLSDTSVLDPLAWPSALQWYTLTVDSAGCSASDSTPVAPVLLNAITAFADTTVCYGSTVQIAVNGAFSVVWDYHPTLSATNVHNPIATPVADRTVYHYTATDVCGCDTIRDSIVVDVICCADIPVTARLVNPSAATWAWPTTGGVYQIEGTFLVTVPINFSHTTFLMEDGAEVRIEQTGYLRTDHSHFRTACGDSMWQGITLVEPGARLGMVTDTIQDARKAVWSKFGATFSIVSSLVRDNWIGVHMDQHPGNHTGLVLGTHFAANPFALLPPYRSVPAEAGIWIDRVGQATIGLPGAANRNTFDSVAIGVLVNRSHAVVQNCRFNRVLPKPNVPGGPGTGGYASGIFAKGVFGTGQQAFRLRVGEQAGAITGAGCRFGTMSPWLPAATPSSASCMARRACGWSTTMPTPSSSPTPSSRGTTSASMATSTAGRAPASSTTASSAPTPCNGGRSTSWTSTPSA
jgi:PKD repeat protein